MHDRPLVSEEDFVPCRVDSEDCEGQVTSDRLCDVHRLTIGGALQAAADKEG
jgi:hypothetical protein